MPFMADFLIKNHAAPATFEGVVKWIVRWNGGPAGGHERKRLREAFVLQWIQKG